MSYGQAQPNLVLKANAEALRNVGSLAATAAGTGVTVTAPPIATSLPGLHRAALQHPDDVRKTLQYYDALYAAWPRPTYGFPYPQNVKTVNVVGQGLNDVARSVSAVNTAVKGFPVFNP